MTKLLAKEVKMKKLDGKVAVVTGAGRGIGRGIALRLATLGARVAVVDKNLKSFEAFEAERARMKAGSTVEEICMLGTDAIGFELDVTDREAQIDMARRVVEEWGRIDVLVANAGGGSKTNSTTRASVLDQTDLVSVLERNLNGTVYSVNAVAPYMKQQGSGRIITIGSVAGSAALDEGGYAHYGAAKAGVAMYTRYLAQDLGEHGIHANCVAAGRVATGRVVAVVSGDNRPAVPPNALRRIGTIDDIANVVEFLSTDLSSYVTGAVIQADGGMVRGAI